MDRARAVVIATGNEMRGDDRVGLDVAARIEARLPSGVELVRTRGDATALLELWKGRSLAVVIDAVRGGGAPGEVVTFDVLSMGPNGGLKAGLPVEPFGASTHDFGLAQGLELGALMGALPERLRFIGIVGTQFGIGEPMGKEVGRAVDAAAQRVLAALEEFESLPA